MTRLTGVFAAPSRGATAPVDADALALLITDDTVALTKGVTARSLNGRAMSICRASVISGT